MIQKTQKITSDTVIREETLSLVKNIYLLFAASIFVAALGAFLAIPYAGYIAQYYWFIAIPWMLYGMFGLSFFAKTPVFNIISLYAFATMGGVIITPLLSHILGISNGISIIINSFLMTTVLFGALSLFALKSKTDFTGYTKPLFIAFIVMIIFSLINIFILQSPMIHIVIQSIFLLIISFSVIHSTQHIVQGNITSPIMGASMLFIDFFNLFITLLQLMGIFGSDD